MQTNFTLKICLKLESHKCFPSISQKLFVEPSSIYDGRNLWTDEAGNGDLSWLIENLFSSYNWLVSSLWRDQIIARSLTDLVGDCYPNGCSSLIVASIVPVMTELMLSKQFITVHQDASPTVLIPMNKSFMPNNDTSVDVIDNGECGTHAVPLSNLFTIAKLASFPSPHPLLKRHGI